MVVTAGCSGSGGSSSNSPQIRVLNAVAADPIATVQVGTTTVVTALPYATESGSTRNPYFSTTTGTQAVTFLNGTTPFATGQTTLLPSQSVNVIATPNNNASLIVLDDDTSIATDSELRIVNASSATNLPSADVVFTPSGGGAATTYTVTTNSVTPVQPAAPGFLYDVVNPADYLVQVFPTGQESSGTPLLSESINLVTGQRWTFIVVDSNSTSSKIELVQVQDSPEISVSLAKSRSGSKPL